MRDTMVKGYTKIVLKQVMMFMMVVTLACLISPMVVMAKTAYVTADTANVRKDADTSSDVVTSVKGGNKITIDDEKTGADGEVWYYITMSDGKNGYIRHDLVGDKPKSESADGVLHVLAESANIRNEASTDGAIVANVSRGVDLTVKGKTNGTDGKVWYQISFTHAGQTVEGYIRSDLATFDDLPEEEGESTEITGSTSSEGDDDEVVEEESTEEVPQEESTEESVQPGTSTNEYTIITTVEDAKVPLGYIEVQVEWNGVEVRSWKNGDFFIFRAVAPNGEEGYVRYDSVEKVFQRYDEAEAQTAGFFGNMGANITMIILVVLLTAAIVVAVMFYQKYSDSLIEAELDEHEQYSLERKEKAKNAWKSLNFLLTEEDQNEEYDEEEYDEDEYDDEYEDEYESDYIDEEVAPVKVAKPQPRVQKTQQAPVRKVVQPAPARVQPSKPVQVAKKPKPVQPAQPVKQKPVQQAQPVKQKPKPAQPIKQKEKVSTDTQMLSDVEFIDIDSL